MPQPRKPRVGVGGWVFAPWRGAFYPSGLPQKRELAYASEALSAIEINSTYHSLQKPDSFARWADETPEDFAFAVKASRYCTNRRELSGAGEAVDRFFTQGLDRLGSRLGPILWQFMPTKKFDPEDFEGFLSLLPKSLDGRPLRHALEVRHESFRDERFANMARAHGAAVVLGVSESHPTVYVPGGPLAYLRLMGLTAAEPLGLSGEELDLWAARVSDMAAGRRAEGLQALEGGASEGPSDVFVFLINGAKERAPLAARALLDRLSV